MSSPFMSIPVAGVIVTVITPVPTLMRLGLQVHVNPVIFHHSFFHKSLPTVLTLESFVSFIHMHVLQVNLHILHNQSANRTSRRHMHLELMFSQ